MLSCSQGAGHHGGGEWGGLCLSFQIKSSSLSTSPIPFGQLRLQIMDSRTHQAPFHTSSHLEPHGVPFPKADLMALLVVQGSRLCTSTAAD